MQPILESASNLEARLRAESTRRVAEGQGPEPKMAGTGIMSRAAGGGEISTRWSGYQGRKAWWFYRNGLTLRMVGSDLQGNQTDDDVLFTGSSAMVSHLDMSITRGDALVATTPGVLVGITAEVGSASNKLLNALTYAQMSPLASNIGTVEAVLSRRFWAPTGSDGSLRSWLDAFGKSRDVSGMLALAPYVFGGELSGYQASLASSVSYLEKNLINNQGSLRRFSLSMAAFTLAESAQSLWTAMLCDDAIYRPYATALGLCPRIDVLRVDHSGDVVASVSTPCRLRAGDSVEIVYGNQRVGAAVLAELSFDDDHGLVGTFTTSTRSRQGNSRGFAFLARNIGAQVFVCATPFRPSKLQYAPTAWDPRSERKPVVRDVPLDVVLAGS